MKLLVLAVLLSSSAYARQYIQCRTVEDTTDVMVINLTTNSSGTVMLSPGAEYDEHHLLQITSAQVMNHFHEISFTGNLGSGVVNIPRDVIGKDANNFEAEVVLNDVAQSFGCFSRIYID